MTWDIYMCIIRVACLKQGEKINVSSLIQIKIKNKITKTNCIEIISNIIRVLIRVPTGLLWKKKLADCGPEINIFLRLTSSFKIATFSIRKINNFTKKTHVLLRRTLFNKEMVCGNVKFMRYKTFIDLLKNTKNYKFVY